MNAFLFVKQQVLFCHSWMRRKKICNQQKVESCVSSGLCILLVTVFPTVSSWSADLLFFFHAIDADVCVCFSFWFKMRPLFQWVLYLNSEKFKKQKQRIQVRKKLKYFSVFISFSMGCVVLFNKLLLILSCHQSISLYSRMKCISLEGKHFVSVCVLHFRVLSASYR